MTAPLRHLVVRGTDAAFEQPARFADHADGFTRWDAVDQSTPGAVHTGFRINRLEPGGSVGAHVHAYEETGYVLDGSLTLDTTEGSVALRPGDYGLIPMGSPHAWRNSGTSPVRWASMLAPQPRSHHGEDTWFVAEFERGEAVELNVRDPRTRSYGHIDPENMDVAQQTQDRLAVSASMRTALLVYSGITVKMMVDSDLGAHLQTMFMVQYQPDGFAGAHDHPFEETYLILDGGVDAVFDGVEYRLDSGDIAFAGVGAVHEFRNPGTAIVRWLETQAPQPPARHSYRFARDWRYLEEVLST